MYNLRVVVGSKNNVKVDAIKNIFKEYQVTSYNAKSGVSDQPIGDDETIRGAINRAKEARLNGDIGIGLEGGVTKTSYGLLVISYGALVDQNNQLFIAGGTRFILPKEIELEIDKGIELGDVMNDYANRKHVKHNEGAVGIFTNNLIKRQEIFEHIGKLLLGQMNTNKNSISL